MPLTGLVPPLPPVHPPRRPERVIAIAALAAVLLHEPFLSIFDKGAQARIAGIPILFAYLFIVWAIIICLTALVMESRLRQQVTADDETTSPVTPAAASGRIAVPDGKV